MLIVGLGNPGKEYENTRHNIGFMFVDEIGKHYNASFKLSKKHQALIAEITINNEKHYLIKPVTYMNLSGIAVKSVSDYYKIPTNEIVIAVDDLDLDVGKIRIKPAGSSGGHNGLKSIFSYMKTENITRIRIGIAKNAKIDQKDYVLGTLSNSEREVMKETINYAPNIIEDLVKNGVNFIMNKYNGMFKGDKHDTK